MVEDHNRNAAEGATTTGLLNYDNNYYYDDDGKLTEVFRNQIEEIKNQELLDLEHKITQARPA